MFKILENSIRCRSFLNLKDLILVDKANLSSLLKLLTQEQMQEALRLFGVLKPDLSNLEDLSKWAQEAMQILNIKQKQLAEDSKVNPCDITYLLNGDSRLGGTGRREKIINKLYEKLEEKFFDDMMLKSS